MLAAILILTLGVGVNAAVFSPIHSMLLRSLPVNHPEQLVEISEPLNGPALDALSPENQLFSGVFGWHSTLIPVNSHGETRSEHVALVTGGAFQTLGIHAASGRLLEAGDDQPGGGAEGWKCVVAHRLWNSRAVGGILKVDGQSVTVIGVAPEGFDGIETGVSPSLYLPLEFDAEARHRPGSSVLSVSARLKKGVLLSQAESRIRDVQARQPALPNGMPSALPWSLTPLRHGGGAAGRYLRRHYRLPLLLLQALAILLLLLCYASLAWLFAAQVAGMRGEFAVRLALGATWWDLWRPIFLLHLSLSVTGAMTGLWLASRIAPFVIAYLIPPDMGITIMAETGGMALVGAAMAALGSAGMPAFFLTANLGKVHPAEGLRQRHALGADRSETGLAQWLPPAQAATATALTVAAMLLGTTLFRLLHQPFGFDRAGVHVMQLDFTAYDGDASQMARAYRSLFDRMSGLREIQSFSLQGAPMLRDMRMTGSFQAHTAGGTRVFEDLRENDAGANYFRTFGTRVVQGRDFKESDRLAAIVNESAARGIFPGENALGKYISDVDRNGKAGEAHEIVGVVENAKYDSVREAAPMTIYQPYTMADASGLPPALQLVVRTNEPGEAERDVHGILSQIAPDAPLNPLISMSRAVRESTGRERILALLSLLLSGLSLLMTAAGIYGTLAWQIRRRIPEIGLRFALGASRARIAGLFLGQTFSRLVMGCGVGLALGYALSRYARSFLYGVDARAPWVYGACLLLIAVAGAMAALVPVLRAAAVDPMVALRLE